MKKLIALFLFTIPFFGFKQVKPVEGLAGLKNLVGHTWLVEYKQVKGGPDVSKKKQFAAGVKDNVINYKVNQRNNKTGEYEYYSEGIIVYSPHSDEVYFSETHYSGDVFMGEVLIDGDGFTFLYANSTFKIDHFSEYYEQYTLENDTTYKVTGYIYQEGKQFNLNLGSSKQIK